MSINKIMRRVHREKAKKGTNVLGEDRNVGSLRRSIETTRAFRENQERERKARLLKEGTAPTPEPDPEGTAPTPEGGEGIDEKRSTAAERRKKRLKRKRRERSGKPKDRKRARAAKRARAKHKAAFRRGAKLAARLRDAMELANEAKSDFDEYVGGLDEEARSVILSTLEEMSQEEISAWLNEEDTPEDETPMSEGDDPDGGEPEGDGSPIDEAGKKKCNEDDDEDDDEDDEEGDDDDMGEKKESLEDPDSDPVFEMLMKHAASQVDKHEDDPLDVGRKTQDVSPGQQVVGRDPDPSAKGKVDNPKGDAPTYPDHGKGQKTYDY